MIKHQHFTNLFIESQLAILIAVVHFAHTRARASSNHRPGQATCVVLMMIHRKLESKYMQVIICCFLCVRLDNHVKIKIRDVIVIISPNTSTFIEFLEVNFLQVLLIIELD
jgi:hypothetical protein